MGIIWNAHIVDNKAEIATKVSHATGASSRMVVGQLYLHRVENGGMKEIWKTAPYKIKDDEVFLSED